MEKLSIKDKVMKNKAYPVILLTLVVLISILLLMYINSITKAIITKQKEDKTLAQLEQIFPDMDNFKFKEEIYIVYRKEDVLGYAFTAAGKGYGGEISTLVGIDNDYKIKLINVLSNNETPGLGTKIIDESFTGQFKGLGIDELEIKSEGGKIDAITGATISSKALTSSVKEALRFNSEIIESSF